MLCKENRLKDNQYFTGLDGLRGIFCIGIAIYHVGGVFDFVFPKWLGFVYEYGGYFGNYMFFIISGFLTAYGYQKRIKEKEYTFVGFMIKHLKKIYPVYVLSNLAMMYFGNAPFTVERVIVTFLMGYGGLSGKTMPYNFPTWFLCILLICYGLYYIVAALSDKYPKAYVPLCVGLVVWGVILEICDWSVPLNYRTCGEGYLNFFLGVILAEVLSAEKTGAVYVKIVNCFMLFFLIAVMWFIGFDNLYGDMRWWISGLCINLASAAVHEGWIAKILSWDFFHMIGIGSKDIFLWHIPVVWAFLRLAPKCSAGSSFLLYMLTLAAFTTLLYYGKMKGKEFGLTLMR